MSTQPNGPTDTTGPPPTLADLLHVEMTPELRAKYIDLLGQHTGNTEPLPPKTATEKQAVDLPLEELSPEFSFDSLNILGTDSQGRVCLQGIAKEDPSKPFVILTPRRAFEKAMDYWLGSKAGDSLQAFKCIELPEADRCNQVRTFYVASFEKDCNMEQG